MCCGADDNIVVLRAASRAEPQRGQGSLSLNFSKGIVFDTNAANRLLERLRKVRSPAEEHRPERSSAFQTLRHA